MRASSFLVPAGYGWLAGMRSVAAQATAGSWLARAGRPRGVWARTLARPTLRVLVPALALAEVGADKWSGVPDRTRPVLLAARLASGALAASAVASRLHGPRAARRGAVLGALAALASTFAHRNLRLRAARAGIGQAASGWVEDAAALGISAALARAV